jgi:hypothetical protein
MVTVKERMETAEERMVKLATEMAGGAVLGEDQVRTIEIILNRDIV